MMAIGAEMLQTVCSARTNRVHHAPIPRAGMCVSRSNWIPKYDGIEKGLSGQAFLHERICEGREEPSWASPDRPDAQDSRTSTAPPPYIGARTNSAGSASMAMLPSRNSATSGERKKRLKARTIGRDIA